MNKLHIAIVALFAMGSDCESSRLYSLDNGRLTIDGETEMTPCCLPWRVVSDLEIAPDAIAWWDRELGENYFELDNSAWQDNYGVLFINCGTTGIDDPAGVFYDATDGNGSILQGAIVISSDIAYHEETVFYALLHEMGHALGLADDPYSLDLNSIMSSPLIIGGELTDHDRDLLLDL